MDRDKLVDLIYDALIEFVENDPSEYVDKEDIEDWLEVRGE